jgi:hypothetical protein
MGLLDCEVLFRVRDKEGTMNKFSAVGLFAAGAAVGAVLALFYTSASARQTFKRSRNPELDNGETAIDRSEENRAGAEYIGSLAG